MDFETYKAKIQGFATCFVLLGIIRNFKEEMFEKGTFSDVKNEVTSSILGMMTGDEFSTPKIFMPVPVEMLESIKNVNLAADLKTLTQQAEAVKQEIILHGKLLGISTRATKMPHVSPGTLLAPESKGTVIDDLPMTVKITDYIRNPAGKIVNPFDFWQDCIEVYLLKHLHKLSNPKIAKAYTFKTSATAQGRQREQVVANLLDETERLRKAVLKNTFPPMTLSAGKQPTMIN